MILSKYKDMLGTPGTGFHKPRFLNTAILDYLGSILIAMGISYKYEISLVYSTIFILTLGIFFHWLFGVKISSDLV